jgi:SHS2 domain-containing protein
MARPVEGGETVRELLDLSGDDWEDLFVHWMNTLLLRSELAGAWWTRFDVRELGPNRVVAEVAGPRRGPGHELMREVKAVSYHDLGLDLAPGRCRAHVVLDL